MKLGGFDISAKKVVAGIGLFTAGTIAAVMGKSKITDSVTKSEPEKDIDVLEEVDDAEIVELHEESSDEPVIDIEEAE